MAIRPSSGAVTLMKSVPMPIIDRINCDRWVSDPAINFARIDVQRAEEKMSQETIFAYAKSHDLASYDLLDICFHKWYDMENPDDFKWFYGDDVYDRETIPKPPARWLLRSTWFLRERAIGKLKVAS
jgi:hypothetical protein